MNGSTRQQYEYDDLYRLTKANGKLNSSKGYASYSLMMKYDNLHNITHKELGHTVFGSYPKESNYELDYQYSQERPHQLSQIKELTVTAGEEKTHKYSYDPNGNMVHRQEDIHYRSLIWDEENRLMGVNDEGYASRYVYDDTGERVLKSSGGVTQVSVNGTSMGTMEDMKNYTGYLSPYFVFKEGSFTKHIYAGTERIVSQIGNGEFNNNSGGLGGNGITAGSLNFAQVQDWYEMQKEKYIASLGVPPGPPDKKGIYASPQYTGKPWPDFGSPLNSSLNTPPKGWPKMPVFNPPGGPPGPPVQFGPAQTNDSVDGGWGYQGTGTFEEDRYFYHHDHLGSSSYLTNQLGNITQHVEYIPFGEVFVEEKNDKWNTPYKFNGKELDEETGLYYYGARYLDSKMSLFLSVDPLVESTMDPYGYCYQNPLKFIDPTGMSGKNWVEGIDGMIYWRDDVNEENCQEVLEEGEKHLGESFSVGNLTYAADGKIYDDSEAGGGQPIANGRIQYIEEIEVQAKTYTPFYIGLSADAALIGGLGGSVGLVRDSYGRWGAYATFKGNIGLGAGVGLEGGAIKPEGRNIFKLEDFKGESSSYNIGVFGVGGSYGGTVGKNWKPTKKMDYRKWGNTQDGYTTKGGVFGETARPTLKNAKVSASVMYSYGITRVSSL